MIGQDRARGLVGRHGDRRLLGLGVTRRQLLFFGDLDVGDVGADDALGITHALHVPRIHPERVVAESLDQAERVCDEENRLAAALELGKFVQTLVREAFVADREHFVDEQHVGIDMDGDGKPEPHVHAGRVRLDGRIDEVFHLRKVNDLVEAACDFALGQPEHDAVDEDILTAGDLRMKPGAELDEGRDAAVDAHASACRLRDAGHEFEEGALA